MLPLVYISHSLIWVLALNLCPAYDYYTLHGLWPGGEYCQRNPFRESTIDSLKAALDKYWPSCPQYHHSNLWLWNHEWTKHGTCRICLNTIIFPPRSI
jgi:ribonuclease I